MSEVLTAFHASLLARVALFAKFDRIALARLAACVEPLTFEVDDSVCREGDAADGLYVVVRGTYGVFARDPATGHLGRIASLTPGDVFGELALLEDEPRTATVRAETGGEVLRLERERFLDLLKVEPAIGLAIAANLGRRLRERDRIHLDDREATVQIIETTLATLPANQRDQLLESSVLVEPVPATLRAMFGSAGDQVHEVLQTLSVHAGRPSAAVQGELRAHFARAVGVAGVENAVEAASQRLLAADLGEEALRILDFHGRHPAFGRVLAQVLRSVPQLSAERQAHWLARLVDDEPILDPQLALAWSAVQERRGAQAMAISVLRRGLRAEPIVRDPISLKMLTAELARLETGGAASFLGKVSRRWRTWLALGIATGCIGLVGALTVAGQANSTWSFALLLVAAVVLWIVNVFPPSTVGLGLVAAWILSGTARPDQAIAGFATLDWLFVLAVFGISAAVAGSGLLFRVGLLLVRRLPDGLLWQSGSLLLTGLLLTPLLPTATGRAAITEPLALAVSDALRLRDRQPAAAVLGLAAWIGAGPLRFVFLNGSSVCLLAWGLLPAASRARFDWIHWSIGALPLGLVVGLGGLLMLFLVLRPGATPPTPRGHLDVQLAVLGPPSRRELAMLAVLLLTVCGWIAAPSLRIDVAVIALLGLLAAVATGNFGRQAVQALDWDYLIFYGVALSLVRLSSALGLDRLVGEAIGLRLADTGASALVLVLGVAVLGVVVCQVLGPDQTVLLVGLALVPTAQQLGLDPWVVVVTVLATTGVWLIPSQVPMYLGAYSASEGRLFSPSQSRRAAFGYLAVLLVALAVSVPYWHVLGLL